MTSLSGKIVVVTGASSGIGRAAAREFAKRGARLVVAARREQALEELATECRELGAAVLVVPTDVARDDEVERLVTASLALENRIDVWVNNAGTTLFGPLEDGPFDAHQRVIDTNLFGAMRCARLVVPVFRRQQRGVMVNVGSILSKIGQPFVPSYVISKFGLRGLSEALRAELADLPHVHVCTLFPYATATPHFESGANFTGLAARPIPPVQPPATVAKALVDLAARPRRERHVPRIALLGLALHALAPRAVERVLFDVVREWHLGPEPEARTRGNLEKPHPSPTTAQGTRLARSGTLGFVAWFVKYLGHLLGAPMPKAGR